METAPEIPLVEATPRGANGKSSSMGDSIGPVVVETEEKLISSVAASNKTTTRRKTRSQRQPDVLEQQMQSVLGKKRVRTTKEIVEELSLKSHSPAVATRTANQDELLPDTTTTLGEPPAADSAESKSELMNRFFESQNGVEGETLSPPSTEVASLSSGTVTPGGPFREDDPAGAEISEVMSRLPLINAAEEFKRMDDEAEDEDVEGLIPIKRPQLEVTDELVVKLHEEPMESFNGNFNHSGEFCEWNEVVTKETVEGDLLYVLPYSVIE